MSISNLVFDHWFGNEVAHKPSKSIILFNMNFEPGSGVPGLSLVTGYDS